MWKESRNIYLVNVSNRLKRKLFSLEKKTIDISSKKYINFCVSDYAAVYEILFEGALFRNHFSYYR